MEDEKYIRDAMYSTIDYKITKIQYNRLLMQLNRLYSVDSAITYEHRAMKNRTFTAKVRPTANPSEFSNVTADAIMTH